MKTTTSTKSLYLSINKLCDRLWEMSKQDEKLVRVSLDKTYHLILDGKYMYDNKFNKQQYNCIPIALSVYPGEFLSRNELCKLFNCSMIYITIRKEGKEHILDKNKSLQVIHIPTIPDEFENKDGDTIRYFKIWNNNEYNNETAMNKYRKFLDQNKKQ